MSVAEKQEVLDLRQIQAILPHRYPFLLVDRMLEVEERKRGVGLKNVTANEPHFQGHFPGQPVMPGVLITEALAQVGAIVMMKGDDREIVPYLAGIDSMRFRRPVVPGDQLRLEAELIAVKGDIGKMRVKATVEGKVAAEGEMMFALKVASQS